MDVDLRLYALVDPAVAGGRTLPVLAAQIAGSATLVQLRDKHGSTRAMVEEARGLRAVLEPKGIPLLVNDRVDVALAAEADGVHIGQEDMAVPDARLLLGRSAIIGLSIKTVQQAEAAPLPLLDYVAIGGVYGDDVEGQYVDADWPHRPSPHCRGHSCAQGGLPDLRHCRDQCRQRRRRDFCRRRWRGGDFGIVAGARSGRAAQELRAVVDGALARRGAP